MKYAEGISTRVAGRCQLSAISEGLMSSGPNYTFIKGEVRTTIDYILMDLDVASMMMSKTSMEASHG